LKFCKTTLPLALHLTPILKIKKGKKSDEKETDITPVPGPIPLILSSKNCASTYIHSFGEIHFSCPEKKNN